MPITQVRSSRLASAFVLAATFAAASAMPAAATHTTVTRGANFGLASSATPSTAEQFLGGGSWYKLYPGAKTEHYLNPANDLGASFTIDQIQSITYRTLNNGTNPSGVDFYLFLYTAPYGAAATPRGTATA